MHMNEATPLLPNALNINDLHDTRKGDFDRYSVSHPHNLRRRDGYEVGERLNFPTSPG